MNPDINETSRPARGSETLPEDNARMAELFAERGALTIRTGVGLSGDMILCGLAVMNMKLAKLEPTGKESDAWLKTRVEKILPGLGESVSIIKKSVNCVSGYGAKVNLPHEHEHRNLGDILALIEGSKLSAQARAYAARCFKLLARCEAEVHDVSLESVHFHEVGALDSILDICVSCELFCELGTPRLMCSPLPVADGVIDCAHGKLPAPAPATLKLLRNVPVRPFAGDADAGELVTPTAIALLLTLNAEFGNWPAQTPLESALIYGDKVFSGVPNGAFFIAGVEN